MTAQEKLWCDVVVKLVGEEDHTFKDVLSYADTLLEEYDERFLDHDDGEKQMPPPPPDTDAIVKKGL